jgi:hypothetical protein
MLLKYDCCNRRLLSEVNPLFSIMMAGDSVALLADVRAGDGKFAALGGKVGDMLILCVAEALCRNWQSLP